MKKKIIIFLFLFFLLKVNFALAFSYENPLKSVFRGRDPDINILIGHIVQSVLGIVGALALAMFIYGGFLWLLSGGNNEQVQKGKNVLIYASLGLIIIFSAYAIVHYILLGLSGQ